MQWEKASNVKIMGNVMEVYVVVMKECVVNVGRSLVSRPWRINVEINVVESAFKILILQPLY